MREALLACGIAGPLLFLLIFTLEGAQRPDYRSRRHFVSLLALGPRGWVQTANFLVCGALMLCFALGVAGVIPGAERGGLAPVLFGVFGVGLILSGLFASDPALGYPVGTPTTPPSAPSRHGNLHGLAGVIVFASLPVTCFVLARRFAGNGELGWCLSSVVTGVLMPSFFLTAGMLAERIVSGRRADAPVGLFQRLSIATGWLWIALVATHFL